MPYEYIHVVAWGSRDLFDAREGGRNMERDGQESRLKEVEPKWRVTRPDRVCSNMYSFPARRYV